MTNSTQHQANLLSSIYKHPCSRKCKNLPLALYLIFYLAQAGAALPEKLGCISNSDPKIERQLIAKQADGVVKRVSKHHLTVQTSNGPKEFYDKPPYDEEYEGFRYYYCARRHGLILVLLHKEDLLTGLLVNEATGKITPAGEIVWLSQDHRAYLASEQQDGMEGNLWSVYSIDGRKTWSGYSFIARSGTTLTMEAYLSDPIWTASGELRAEASCSNNIDKIWQVKLVKKAGVWDWRPRKSCR